jgi:hypothetical protein
VAEYAFSANLTVGGLFNAAVSWVAAGRPGSIYVVALLAQTGGVTHTLAQDLVSVVVPAVSLSVAHRLRGGARVLVLVSCNPGHANQQEDSACAQDRAAYLHDLLGELGYEHKVVASAEELTRELRCGRYDVYWISGGARKLSHTAAKELREAVYGGAGLLVDGSHDERNGLLDEALGVAYRGKLSGGAPEVLLGSELFEPAELNASGTALRLDLAGGIEQARFAASHQPAIVSHVYGEGQALIAGFDLVASLRGSGSAAEWRAALVAMLDRLAPTPETVVAAGAAVPLRTVIQNKGRATRVELRIALPLGAAVLSTAPAAGVTESEARWLLDLSENGTQTVDLTLRLPAGAASHDLSARVAVVGAGGTQPYGTYPLAVEARGIDQLFSAALDALSVLQPTQQSCRQKGSHARTQLDRVQAALAEGDHAGAIVSVIDAIDDLLEIRSANVAGARLALDRLLEGIGLEWCAALCSPALPHAHNGEGFVPFSALEGLEARGGRSGAADWEWGLGANTQQTGSFVQQSFEWRSDRTYRWSLSYDGTGGGSVSVWDGRTRLFAKAYQDSRRPLRAGNAIELYVKSNSGLGSAKIQATLDAIDDKPVSTTLATAGNGQFSEAFSYFFYPPMRDGFTLTGSLKLSFNGSTPPQGSRLAFTVTSGMVSCQRQ